MSMKDRRTGCIIVIIGTLVLWSFIIYLLITLA